MNIELFFCETYVKCTAFMIYVMLISGDSFLFSFVSFVQELHRLGSDHLSSHSSMIQSILHSSHCQVPHNGLGFTGFHSSNLDDRTWNPRTPITKRYVLCHAWTGRVPCGMPGESSSMVDIWDALDETWILQKLRCWHGRGRRSSAVPKNNRKKQVMVWKLSAQNWEAFCWVTSCWFYGVWMAEVGYLAKRILEPSGRGREFSQ